VQVTRNEAIQESGRPVVVLGDYEPIVSRNLDIGIISGALGRPIGMALSAPSFVDIPLVRLKQERKPTKAEWRRQMKGRR
jgi:hypothetical protein